MQKAMKELGIQIYRVQGVVKINIFSLVQVSSYTIINK